MLPRAIRTVLEQIMQIYLMLHTYLVSKTILCANSLILKHHRIGKNIRLNKLAVKKTSHRTFFSNKKSNLPVRKPYFITSEIN